MNMISQLRQRVQQSGKAEITPEEFDQLQAEWITRTGAADLVTAAGFTVLKTMLEVFDTMGNPAQFRFALAMAVVKRDTPNAEFSGATLAERPTRTPG